MDADQRVCGFGPESQYVDLAAEVFRLLSDPTRIRIVLALREGELSVNELAEVVGKPAGGVSQHLAKLRWGRVVAVRQEGTKAYYRLIDEHARRLVADAVAQAHRALGEPSAHEGAGLGGEPAIGEGGGGQ